MRKFHYNFTRIPPRTIPLLIVALLGPAIASPQQPPLLTASLESHEGLTISATPWTEPSKYKEKLPSLSAADLAQAVFKPGGKDPTKRQQLPIPVTITKSGKDKNWDELQREAQDAGVPTGVIGPHSTVQGLLYFGLQNQFDLLETAHFYVPDLVFMRGNRALTYFDIDLSQRESQ